MEHFRLGKLFHFYNKTLGSRLTFSVPHFEEAFIQGKHQFKERYFCDVYPHVLVEQYTVKEWIIIR